MNNPQLALLLTQYKRALEQGINIVADKLPEYKETGKNIIGLEYTTYPVLDSLWQVHGDMAEDIEKLEKSSVPELPEPVQTINPQRNLHVTFEGDSVDVNGVALGSHDLLMYARSIIRKRAKHSADAGRVMVELQDLIEHNQAIGGREAFSRMPMLEDGLEI